MKQNPLAAIPGVGLAYAGASELAKGTRKNWEDLKKPLAYGAIGLAAGMTGGAALGALAGATGLTSATAGAAAASGAVAGGVSGGLSGAAAGASAREMEKQQAEIDAANKEAEDRIRSINTTNALKQNASSPIEQSQLSFMGLSKRGSQIAATRVSRKEKSKKLSGSTSTLA